MKIGTPNGPVAFVCVACANRRASHVGAGGTAKGSVCLVHDVLTEVPSDNVTSATKTESSAPPNASVPGCSGLQSRAHTFPGRPPADATHCSVSKS
mgnify:CR=1 FL=1